MLKKAGIIALMAAAGLVAVSPLAFAGSREFDDNGTKQVNEGDESYALVNASNNNLVVPVNVCNNHVPVNVLGIQVPFTENDPTAPIQGALGVLSNVDQDEDVAVENENECDADGTAGDTQVNSRD